MKEIDGQFFFFFGGGGGGGGGVVCMSPNRFEHSLELIKPMIMKNNAVRAPIPPLERLAIAIRFLASGESQASLSWCYFKIEKETVCGI